MIVRKAGIVMVGIGVMVSVVNDESWRFMFTSKHHNQG